jgi:steroid delta-isomerase-like uncharacterized protein
MAGTATAARERLAHEYLAAWNSHDAAAIAAFFAADGRYDDVGAGESADGSAAIRAHAQRVLEAFPDLRFELVRVAHGEGFSCAEWRCEMTHRGELFGLRPTGRRASSAGIDIATLDGEGRIEHLASYYDGAAIMRALGLLPERGSRLERALLRFAPLLRRRPL